MAYEKEKEYKLGGKIMTHAYTHSKKDASHDYMSDEEHKAYTSGGY